MDNPLLQSITIEEKLLNASGKLLKDRTFHGKFTDRRYVEVVGGYRDAIYVDRKELVLLEDLQNIQDSLTQCPSVLWSSIINCGKQTVICTRLPEGIPLGSATWKIVGVGLLNNELILDITLLSTDKNSLDGDLDWNNLVNATVRNLRETITTGNMKECTKYVLIVVLTLINVTVELVRLFIVFIAIVMHNFPRVMDSVMPLALAVVNGVTKCIGGLYILIAMMWRGNGQRPMPANYDALRSSSDGQLRNARFGTRAITSRNSDARKQFFENYSQTS